ncbi:prolyl oligopeptidase family serine peptidase [Aestuariivivens sediminis]|uniref:carboxylesterase family protein n=1 Tax=Aestuariivivens sediminis TaxID=2913557 RepID=UPI001F57CCA8|nr:prolyl oligopeptidase family serine peptidase [Aestuariivivens sediminis]
MKKSNIKLVVLMLTFLCCLSTFPLFAQPPRFSFEKYVTSEGDTLNYRLLYPDANPLRKFPLVVFLHGGGENGNDNDAQLKWGVMNFATDQAMAKHPAFVIAPQCPKDMNWFNFNFEENIKLLPDPSKPMELMIKLINELIEKYPIDKNRIYITGLSSGGTGTYDAIQRYPDLFAAAVPVCGGGDISKAASIAHIPMWIIQGVEDPAGDPRSSIDMAKALINTGGRPGLTLYPEVGHFSWLAAYSNSALMEWLFRQQK